MAEHEHPFGHESSAIAVKRVLTLGGVFALLIITAVVALHFGLRDAVMPNHAQIALRPAPIPPPPRLQPSPQEDLAQFRAQKQALLSYYAWSDAKHAYAHIPIARAMRIYVQQHAAQPAKAGSAGVIPKPDARQ